MGVRGQSYKRRCACNHAKGTPLSRIGKFIALPAADKSLYVGTALLLIGVKLGLDLFSLRTVRRWLNRFATSRGIGGDPRGIAEVVAAVERVSAALAWLRITCLPRSLVGDALLRRRGFAVELKIGVRKVPGNRLAAHAWIEHKGKVVVGDLRNLAEFRTFPSLDLPVT
jgi:hypothetical protein